MFYFCIRIYGIFEVLNLVVSRIKKFFEFEGKRKIILEN